MLVDIDSVFLNSVIDCHVIKSQSMFFVVVVRAEKQRFKKFSENGNGGILIFSKVPDTHDLIVNRLEDIV